MLCFIDPLVIGILDFGTCVVVVSDLLPPWEGDRLDPPLDFPLRKQLFHVITEHALLDINRERRNLVQNFSHSAPMVPLIRLVQPIDNSFLCGFFLCLSLPVLLFPGSRNLGWGRSLVLDLRWLF